MIRYLLLLLLLVGFFASCSSKKAEPVSSDEVDLPAEREARWYNSSFFDGMFGDFELLEPLSPPDSELRPVGVSVFGAFLAGGGLLRNRGDGPTPDASA